MSQTHCARLACLTRFSYLFGSYKLHALLDLLLAHRDELDGLYDIVAEPVVELLLYLDALCLVFFRERVEEVFPYQWATVFHHIINKVK